MAILFGVSEGDGVIEQTFFPIYLVACCSLFDPNLHIKNKHNKRFVAGNDSAIGCTTAGVVLLIEMTYIIVFLIRDLVFGSIASL